MKTTGSSSVASKFALVGGLVLIGATASAHVFDDAKILHFGLKDLPATMSVNTWYRAAPDYRHISTWGTNGDTHQVKLEAAQSIVNLVSTNYDISTPTLARTLRNEPCFRVNQSRVITSNQDGVSTSTNFPHGAVDLNGAICSKTKAAWTVLIRFRPDMKGYVRPGDTEWWRLFGLGWESGKHSMLFGLYAGHDTWSGVKVSNGPVRRNQIAAGKFSPVRARMKEAGGEVRRIRTGSGYKAYSRASQQYMAKPQSLTVARW